VAAPPLCAAVAASYCAGDGDLENVSVSMFCSAIGT